MIIYKFGDAVQEITVTYWLWASLNHLNQVQLEVGLYYWLFGDFCDSGIIFQKGTQNYSYQNKSEIDFRLKRGDIRLKKGDFYFENLRE